MKRTNESGWVAGGGPYWAALPGGEEHEFKTSSGAFIWLTVRGFGGAGIVELKPGGGWVRFCFQDRPAGVL